MEPVMLLFLVGLAPGAALGGWLGWRGRTRGALGLVAGCAAAFGIGWLTARGSGDWASGVAIMALSAFGPGAAAVGAALGALAGHLLGRHSAKRAR